MKRRIEEFTRRPVFPILVATVAAAAVTGRWSFCALVAPVGLALDYSYEAGRRAGRSGR